MTLFLNIDEVHNIVAAHLRKVHGLNATEPAEFWKGEYPIGDVRLKVEVERIEEKKEPAT